MRGFLTKRPNGLYCLTYDTPDVMRIGNTELEDVYAVGGDPLAWCSPICDFGRKALFNVDDLETFWTAPIKFEGIQSGPAFETRRRV